MYSCPSARARLGHLLDRRTAVGPVRVGVAVAAQRGAGRRGGLVQRRVLGGLQPAQVHRLLAGAATRRRTARSSRRSRSFCSVPASTRRRRARRAAGAATSRRGAERPDPVRGLAGPLEQEGDLLEVGHRVAGVGHAPTVVAAWQATQRWPCDVGRRRDRPGSRRRDHPAHRAGHRPAGHPERRPHGRRAAVVPRAAVRPALVGHPRGPGRAAVLRRVAAHPRRRPAPDRRGLRRRAAGHGPHGHAAADRRAGPRAIAVAEEHLPALAGADRRATSCARSCCASAARSPSPPRGSTPPRRRTAGRGTAASRRWSSTASSAARGRRPAAQPARGARLARHRPDRRAWSGHAPPRPPEPALAAVHRAAGRLGLDAMAGVHADRLVVVVGGHRRPTRAAPALLPVFGAGPVVIGPVAAGRVGRRPR